MRRGADRRRYRPTPRSPWRSLTLACCVILVHLVSASESPSSSSVNDTTLSPPRGAFGNAHASSSSSPALLKLRRAAGVYRGAIASPSAPLAEAASPPPLTTSRLARNADSHRSTGPKPRQLRQVLGNLLNQTTSGGGDSSGDQSGSQSKKDDTSGGSVTGGTGGTNQTGGAGGGASGFDEENPPAQGTPQGGAVGGSGGDATQPPGGTVGGGTPPQGGTPPVPLQVAVQLVLQAPVPAPTPRPQAQTHQQQPPPTRPKTHQQQPPAARPQFQPQQPPLIRPKSLAAVRLKVAVNKVAVSLEAMHMLYGEVGFPDWVVMLAGHADAHNPTQKPPKQQQPGSAGTGGDQSKQPGRSPQPHVNPTDNSTQPGQPWNVPDPTLIPLPAPTVSTPLPGGNTSTNTGGTGNATAGAPGSLNTNSGGGSGSGSNTWAIVGGVVGGIVLLASAIFIVYRLTQRRFSSLEDEGAEIRWPELNPDGQEVSANTSTLYPLGTTRTGGAGIEMESDKSEWGDEMDYATHERNALNAIPGREAYLARGPTLHARQMSYGALAMQSRSEVGMSPDGYFDSSSEGLRKNPSSQGSYPPSPPNLMAYGGGGGVPPPPVPGMSPHHYGGAIYPGPGQPLPGNHSPPPGGPAHMPPFPFTSSHPSLEGSVKPYSQEQAAASQHRAQKPSSDSIDNYYPEFEPRADTPQHFAVTNPDRASSEVGAGNMDPQKLRHQLSIKAVA
ncbi:BQ5605_C033g11183 [Microbotryum silenes-dioicae]|uniref:BQ5605_C033g11183 protein n=1 Tax=Microbotryum silenes-dioicae TaxID=796604 RepID=A0A2X0PH97_9BASI|nr:BQ5605_C033g11183 [Microbotryum silenes-dioicae]